MIEYMAGDKVKMLRPEKKKKPSRFGSAKAPDFYPVNVNGAEGQVYYGRIYEVSGKEKADPVDNDHKPLPLIDKQFVNHPVFNRLFTPVKEPGKTKNKED